MKFSVVVPTCNRNDLLRKCLELLDRTIQHYTGEYEVIVTDDSKEGNARQMVQNEFPWVHWIEGTCIGPAANRNNGVRSATGDWIIFTDDDCLPQSDWISSYADAIKNNPDHLIFEGKTMADRDQQRYDEVSPINLTGNRLWSCNFSVKKTFFVKLNGFDEAFPFAAMEDVDFYSRVVAHEKIVFVPEALVIHPWRRMKPFRRIHIHLVSHRYLLNKNEQKRGLHFRISKLKIFVSTFFTGIQLLYKYSMKGWQAFIEQCIINFCLIFI